MMYAMYMSSNESHNITNARKQLAAIIDQARADHEPVYLTRRGHRVAAVIDADDLDGILALAEDMADIRAAEEARAEMRATGQSPIPGAGQGRSRSGVTYKVVLSPSAIRQLRNLIRRFVDEYKPSSITFRESPPQLQRASLVVRASGGFGRATTESSTKFMKSSFLFLSFARATVERSTSAEFVLGCCCLCRVI